MVEYIYFDDHYENICLLLVLILVTNKALEAMIQFTSIIISKNGYEVAETLTVYQF